MTITTETYSKNKSVKYDTSLIKKIFKYGGYFFIFNFLNSLLPLFFMIMASFLKDGYIIVVSMGQVLAFQIIFLQLSLTLAIGLYSLMRKYDFIKNIKDRNSLFNISVFISVLFGILLMVFFIGCAYSYNYFLNISGEIHIHEVQQYGSLYILSFSPGIFLNSVATIFSLLIFYKKGGMFSLIMESARFCFIIAIAIIFTLAVPLSVGGISLGFVLGTLIFTIFMIIYVYYIDKLVKFQLIFFAKNMRLLIKDVFTNGFMGMWQSIIKTILIVVIGATIFQKLQEFYSGFYYSKIIWYNLLYFIPFFSNSLIQAIDFYKTIPNQDMTKTKAAIRSLNLLLIVNVLILFIIGIGTYYAVYPLAHVYSHTAPPSLQITHSINEAAIAKDLLLPHSIAFILVFSYMVLFGVGQLFVKIGTFFDVKKVKTAKKGLIHLITKLFFMTLPILLIIVTAVLLEHSPTLLGGISAFSFPMLILGIIYFGIGLVKYINLYAKKYKLYI